MHLKSMWREATKPAFLRGAGISVVIALLATGFAFSVENLILAVLGEATTLSTPWSILAFLVIGAALFLAIAYGLSQVGRQQAARTETVSEVEDQPNPRIGGRRFLIAGFSQFNSGGRDTAVRGILPGEDGFAYTQLSLADAIGAAGNTVFGNWQQILRLVDRLSDHGRPLSHVMLFIGDQGGEGDLAVRQGTRLVEILSHYFGPCGTEGRNVSVTLASDPAGDTCFGAARPAAERSYNDAGYVQDALEACVRHLMRVAGVDKADRPALEDNTYIDVTGGTALTSIAMATFSYNRGFRFVYIGSGTDSDKLFMTKTEVDLGMLEEG